MLLQHSKARGPEHVLREVPAVHSMAVCGTCTEVTPGAEVQLVRAEPLQASTQGLSLYRLPHAQPMSDLFCDRS